MAQNTAKWSEATARARITRENAVDRLGMSLAMATGMLATALSAAILGLDSALVRVEVDVRMGLPHFELVGLAEAAVRESRVRVRSALAQLEIALGEYNVVVNLAPADLKKSGSGFDLAIAAGVLAAIGRVPQQALEGILFLGELSLSGELQPVRGLLPRLLSARAQGYTRAIVPLANQAEASLLCAGSDPGTADGAVTMDIQLAARLEDVLASLSGLRPCPSPAPCAFTSSREVEDDLADVRGQPLARRALEIAAAGRHNLLFLGPPGAGKTMLARRLPGILPPMAYDEALETMAIASVAGTLLHHERSLFCRPFRAPHHTVSEAALIGGGEPPRPGEVSLAHRGVLFLDELPEFRRGALEGLRQPLEDGEVTISRAHTKATYPAVPLLVAAMNPCPCGFLGDPRCRCSSERIASYRGRLSGPLIDRIDLHVVLPHVEVGALRSKQRGESTAQVRERVSAASERQRRRVSTGLCRARSNAELSVPEIERLCALSPACEVLLTQACERLGLSARAANKVLRIARTIADLEGAASIERRHLAEAISFRVLDRARA